MVGGFEWNVKIKELANQPMPAGVKKGKEEGRLGSRLQLNHVVYDWISKPLARLAGDKVLLAPTQICWSQNIAFIRA